MFIKHFLSGKTFLTLVTIQKIHRTVIGKMRDEFRGVIVDKFVGLKSKMYSMKKN